LNVRYCIFFPPWKLVNWIIEFFFWSLWIFIVNRHLDNLCFMHMATNCSSSYCAHGSQPKFKFILCTWEPIWVQIYTHDEKGKERAMIQCITSKVQFCYVCFKYICMFINRKSELLDQFYILHNLNQFMLLDLIVKLKVVTSYVIFYNNQINEFFCYSKQRKICDNKIYCKIFLIAHLYIIYKLWTWLFATCSRMHWQFWKFVISLY